MHKLHYYVIGFLFLLVSVENLFLHHIVFLSLSSYADLLLSVKAEASAKGQEYLTWNDIQRCIDEVNIQVHEEHESRFAQQY